MKECMHSALQYIGATIDDFHSNNCPITCNASSVCPKYCPASSGLSNRDCPDSKQKIILGSDKK